MVKTSTQTLLNRICIIATLCMLFFCNARVFAQKTDSVRITLRGKAVAPKTTQPPVNIPTYRAPSNFISFNSIVGPSKIVKTDKNLSISKIYPNPINDQVNIILRLEKESNVSIKILDILSNEVLTLSNERTVAGEQTKSFTLPKRLNTGIYFLRVIAGQESITKRISVL